jgi:hypothetical protein
LAWASVGHVAAAATAAVVGVVTGGVVDAEGPVVADEVGDDVALAPGPLLPDPQPTRMMPATTAPMLPAARFLTCATLGPVPWFDKGRASGSIALAASYPESSGLRSAIPILPKTL